MRMNNKDWYRQRNYAHFDKALSKKEAKALVENPGRVSRHAFWPLIVSPIKSISRKKVENSSHRKINIKYRPIAYAAHSDSHIYTYYAKKLSDSLEDRYKKDPICDQSVLAYRSFYPKKSNINFASEAFETIKELGSCEVIALDVKGFFDNMDPIQLKRSWQKLLGVKRLEADHYAVFKACTQSYGIGLPKLRDLFGGSVRRRRGQDGSVICSPSVFREKVVPELKPLSILVSEIKKESGGAVCKGIPQGLPISAVLANVYMLETDRVLARYLRMLGGQYQRYSDDILLIVPAGKGMYAEIALVRKLNKLKLSIQQSKTQRLLVYENRSSKKLEVRNVKSGQISVIPYLGFDFCGSSIAVRSSTISRFMIKAKRAIKRAEIAAVKSGTSLKKRQLYARLTTLGYGDAYGKKVHESPPVLPKGAPRLGFFKYMERARQITSSNRIDKQIRKIDQRIHRLIDQAEKRVEQNLENKGGIS